MPKLQRILSLARERAGHEGFKGYRRQLIEMAALWLIRRVGPDYYHHAEMGRVGRGWDYMSGFANSREYQESIRRVNRPLYLRMTQNKSIEKAVLTAYGITTSRYIGHLHPERGFDVKGNDLRSAQDLERVLSESSFDKVCFKPVEGFGGTGFHACRITRGSAGVAMKDMKDGGSRSAGDFVSLSARYHGMVVEEFVEQHPELGQFHPQSVNTIRALVLRASDGRLRNIGTTFRVGRAGSLVDNATAGGIMVDVDVDTGVMRYGTLQRPSMQIFRKHPDSNVPLEGGVLPFFEEMQALARKSLDVFPHLNFAGVDIAYAVDGPVVIEINPQPGKVFMAVNRIPSRWIFDGARAWAG